MSLYRQSAPGQHVLCLDEMGPLGARLYPGKRFCAARDYPHVQPNYGGRGRLWVWGALEPATGEVLTRTGPQRRGLDFVAFLDAVDQRWPNATLILILDNLSVHKVLDVRLWALRHPRVRFLFQPTYAPWLNLIEPWWKSLRALALTGRTFTSVEAMALAIEQATAYWNDHRHPYHWRKAA